MIYWAPLLHFYQPPTQLHWVLRKVCNESYRPLVDLFTDLPYAKVTININAVLTEMLHDHGFDDVLVGLRELANRGQVEFTGSGKYHPILPLIPTAEMERQINHNYKANKRLLGKGYEPKGFFPPEMCYSREILKPVVDAGHRWILISGVACPTAWPMTVVHRIDVDGQKIAVLFRDNILSNKISFQSIDARGFIAHLTQAHTARNGKGDIYVITAMDAETFGHHIQDWEKLILAEVYQSLSHEGADEHKADDGTQLPLIPPSGPEQTSVLARQHGKLLLSPEVIASEARQIEAVTIGELVERFPAGEVIEPRASSWSTEMPDINAGNPYPLWKDPNNVIHQYQWEHLSIAMAMVNKAFAEARTDATRRYADIARALLDAAMHSCQFWWASKRPWWDINLIHKGLLEQHEVIMNAYKAISLSDCSVKEKKDYYYRVLAARDLFNKILDHIFTTPE